LLGGSGLVALISAIWLSRYAERSVGWFSFLSAVLAFMLAFSIVGLVPYDVWGALHLLEQAKKDPGYAPSHLLVRESWAAIYWTTTVLCYLIIPFLIEFEAAGEFSFGARCKKSLKMNAIWYLVYLVIGLAAVVYLLLNGKELHNMGSLSIAASNAWGLLLLTILMGFGLVALPRQLWNSGSPGLRLRELYPLATSRDEAKKSSQYELRGVIAETRKELDAQDAILCDEVDGAGLKQAYVVLQLTLENCEAIQRELLEDEGSVASAGVDETPWARGPEARIMGLQSVPARVGSDEDEPWMVLNRLVKLHCELKRHALEARRSACRFEELVKRCLHFEELEEEILPPAQELLSDMPVMDESFCGKCRHALCRCLVVRRCLRWLQSLWVRRLRTRAYRAAAVACAVMSSIIVLGQLTMFQHITMFQHRFTLSVLTLLFLDDHGPVLTQVLCAVPLSYMAGTAYWSVFRMKIAGWYGLYRNHNTDAGSLLWCSSNLARLALPICYQYLLLVDPLPPNTFQTSFQEYYQEMKFIPIFGHELNQVFPFVVAFIGLCNVTKIYSRVVNCLGLTMMEFGADDQSRGEGSEDPCADGKNLIARERRRRDEEVAMELRRRSESNGMAGAVPLSFGEQSSCSLQPIPDYISRGE